MPTRRVSVDLQRLGFTGLLTIGQRRQTDVRAENWKHRRSKNALEICYVVSGRQTIRVGGKTMVLNGNDLFVNHPGDWHALADGMSERCRIDYLSLDVRRGARMLMLGPHESAGLRRALLALPQLTRGDARTGILFDEALRAARSTDGAVKRVRARAAILLLVTHVLTLVETAQRKATHSDAVLRVLTHVERNLDQTLDVPALTAVSGLSTSRLHAVFKREVGLPPREYVLREKVEAAKRLLAPGTHDVLATTHALGFSSSQYFATVFRRYTGVSPTTWKVMKSNHDLRA